MQGQPERATDDLEGAHLKSGQVNKKPGPARMCVNFLVSFCTESSFHKP